MSLVFSLGLAFQRLTSAPALPPPPAAPVNIARPVITGSAVEGQTLSAGPGSWSNGPASYAYRWRRGGVAIAGATAASYTAGPADVGMTLTVTVTATNAAGSAAATSAGTSAVLAAAAVTAPSLRTPAGIAVTAMAYDGVTYAFTPPVFDGAGVTVSRRLTLGGVDVTGAMTGNTYVAPRSETVLQDMVMTYTASNGTAPDATSVVPRTVPKAMHVIVELGQSNIEYALNNGNPYTNPSILANIPITAVNARYIGPAGGGGIADIPITQASVTARNVNIALAQASQWLNFILPGKQFAFVDMAESGTGRTEFGDDSNPGRDWANSARFAEYAETTHAPADLVVEWWYANDASAVSNFGPQFAPLYLGQNSSGAPHVLGTKNADVPGNPTVWDHCLWDVEAPSIHEKGRGLFARSTKWTYVENHHKDSSLANSNAIAAFWADPRVQAFAAPKGTWAGLYANDDAHALENDADGMVYINWPVVTSIARVAGVTIHEPAFAGMAVASDGSHADLLVDLPNGGDLTTIRIKEGRGAVPALQLPYQQPVTGIEIERIGSGLPRLPIYRTTETLDENGVAIDDRFKGTVVIQDTGSGSPRRGRIRITPTVPFANGDKVLPLWLKNNSPYPQTFLPAFTDPDPVRQAKFRAAATKSWLDFPVERMPALEDPAAFYKFPGVPVRPWGAEQLVSGLAAAPFIFAPRSVVTGAGNTLFKSPLPTTLFAGDEGMLSVWFRFAGTWPSGTASLFQMRNSGGVVVAGLTTASSGRLQSNMAGSGVVSPGTGAFAAGVWQHAMVSWKTGPGGWAQYCVNGATNPINGTVPADSSGLRIKVDGIIRAGVGGSTTGTGAWTGGIGHFYMNLTQALDLRVQANREKFILSGAPVSLGRNGERPTGVLPAFYFDGDGALFNNYGNGPGLTASGTLLAGSAPLLGT
jgi:hypothetical protein